jgi:hypothetical protein
MKKFVDQPAVRGVKKENAKDFLLRLGSEAVTNREIHETSYRKWKKSELDIKASLDALGVFRIKQQLPMIMAVMRDFKSGKLKQSHVEDILRAPTNRAITVLPVQHVQCVQPAVRHA